MLRRSNDLRNSDLRGSRKTYHTPVRKHRNSLLFLKPRRHHVSRRHRHVRHVLFRAFIREHQVEEVQQNQRSEEIPRHEAELVQMQTAPAGTSRAGQRHLLISWTCNTGAVEEEGQPSSTS